MNNALEGAKRKGYEAAKSLKEKRDCPYSDCRKDNGQLTFSRAFRNAWFIGFDLFNKREDECH